MAQVKQIKGFFEQKAEEIQWDIGSKLNYFQSEDLYKAIRYLPLLGGKRLRPIMCLLVAGAFNGNIATAKEFGIALELVHNFTLIHDDIMDEDDKRRGKPTVHIMFDENTAINAGDALFAKSFELISELNLPPEIVVRLVHDVASMAIKIVEGQQLDIAFETRKDVTPPEYFEMIRLKTAMMFETAAKAGAIIAGCSPEIVEKMAIFGKTVGIGFQIWDDVLDMVGNERKLGKPVGSDLIKAKQTIIIIHARNNGSKDQLAKIEKVFGDKNASPQDLKTAVKTLKEIGSIRFARKIAVQYAAGATQIIESTMPPSESRGHLLDIVNFMVAREK